MISVPGILLLWLAVAANMFCTVGNRFRTNGHVRRNFLGPNTTHEPIIDNILALAPREIIKLGQTYPQESKYFFSVMIFVRDEASTILEFIRHYIEEGVDHIFIFDDDSSDGSAASVLECIDSKHYTVYNKTDFGSEARLSQHEAYLGMYLIKGIKFQTYWLAVVDGDEMITSRAYPELSVREILKEYMGDCGMIVVPWNLYVWGENAETPLNRLRYSLNFRMGYDKKYDKGMPAEGSKFRERWNGESNKVIFQTSKVFYFMNTHNAIFSDMTGRIASTVCIPHTATHLECAKSVGGNIYTSDAFHRIANISSGSLNRGLPQYCPSQNTYIANAGSWRTFISEPDISELQLACFHYRIKSKADFLRKTQGDRFNAWQYENITEQIANRMDVYDDFMSSVREKARITHSSFVQATAALSSCPAKYFANSARRL